MFHPSSSPDTVRVPPEVPVGHAGSDSPHESDTSYTQLHTCFYMVYRHGSGQGTERVQAVAGGADGADACMFGVE